MPVTVSDIISITPPPFVVAKATIASILKGGFIRDTFSRDRQVFEKIQRSVIGDMGKLSLKSWLSDNGFDVHDWDDIRRSWKSQRKEYDLQVNNHNIEVRTSIAAEPQINYVLSHENIIHPCNVRVKEITVQVFFNSLSCTEAWLCGWARQQDLENQSRIQVRLVGRRLVDFYMIPFNDSDAEPLNSLLSFL